MRRALTFSTIGYGGLVELTALDVDGRQVRLGVLARQGPLVVCFLRHFG